MCCDAPASVMQFCARFNRGFCQQGAGHCLWRSSKAPEERVLQHACTFVLPCSGRLCGGRDHPARSHKLRPAHCFSCLTSAAGRARLGPTFLPI
jgi:hypothetical protein